MPKVGSDDPVLLLAALAAAALLAVFAPAALAGPSFQLAAGARAPDGLVDPGGTLHVVWADAATSGIVHCARSRAVPRRVPMPAR